MTKTEAKRIVFELPHDELQELFQELGEHLYSRTVERAPTAEETRLMEARRSADAGDSVDGDAAMSRIKDRILEGA